jgi:hypothetical protein
VLKVKTNGKMQDNEGKETSTEEAQSTKKGLSEAVDVCVVWSWYSKGQKAKSQDSQDKEVRIKDKDRTKEESPLGKRFLSSPKHPNRLWMSTQSGVQCVPACFAGVK